MVYGLEMMRIASEINKVTEVDGMLSLPDLTKLGDVLDMYVIDQQAYNRVVNCVRNKFFLNEFKKTNSNINKIAAYMVEHAAKKGFNLFAPIDFTEYKTKDVTALTKLKSQLPATEKELAKVIKAGSLVVNSTSPFFMPPRPRNCFLKGRIQLLTFDIAYVTTAYDIK